MKTEKFSCEKKTLCCEWLMKTILNSVTKVSTDVSTMNGDFINAQLYCNSGKTHDIIAQNKTPDMHKKKIETSNSSLNLLGHIFLNWSLKSPLIGSMSRPFSKFRIICLSTVYFRCCAFRYRASFIFRPLVSCYVSIKTIWLLAVSDVFLMLA